MRPDVVLAPDLAGVTGKEREVLGFIGAGLSNGEIAQQLNLTVATVKSHVGRLLMKLHARDRAQPVIAAYETGLAGKQSTLIRPGGVLRMVAVWRNAFREMAQLWDVGGLVVLDVPGDHALASREAVAGV